MDVFDAIADPVRRGLLEHLAAGPARVVDLTAGRGISRPAVSRHLRVLGEAGLVTATDRGRERHYALVPTPLEEVATWATALSERGGPAASRPPVPPSRLDALDLEVRRTVRERAARPDAQQDRPSGTAGEIA